MSACAPRQDEPTDAYVRFHERASLAGRGGSGLVPVMALLTQASQEQLEKAASELQAALPKGVDGPTAAGMLLFGQLQDPAVPRVELEAESGDEAKVRVVHEGGTALVTLRREQGAWKVALFEPAASVKVVE